MNIAIYQINPDRDENNVAFLNYENLERFQGLCRASQRDLRQGV